MPKQTNFKPLRWFICTLSKEGFHNWELCKEVGLWGVPTNGRNVAKPDLHKGDGLIVYAASRGFKAICKINGDARRPIDKQEAPWAGGVFRYGLVIPFAVVEEFEEPIAAQFPNQRLNGTSITTTQLRRGFSSITAEDGKAVLKLVAQL